MEITTAATTVIVYSKPLCVQCDATQRALRKVGVPFKVIDVTEDAEALSAIKAMGYLQAPVVVAGAEHWSGFHPDRIRALGSAL